MRHSTILVVLIAAVVLAAGCGKPEAKPAAPAPASASAVDISTLPEFLRYPGAEATERVPVTTAEDKGAVWTLVTPDAQDKVEGWYRSSLEQQGWKAPDGEAGKSGMLEWEKPDKSERIKMMVFVKDGKTNISLAHAMKK